MSVPTTWTPVGEPSGSFTMSGLAAVEEGLSNGPIGWRSTSDGEAEVWTCGLPATLEGFRFSDGTKTVRVDVTIGKNPSVGPKQEPMLGISRLVIEVEELGQVLTQTEVKALPLHSMAVTAVRRCIYWGSRGSTLRWAEQFLRPKLPGAPKDRAHDRYRRALSAADQANTDNRTVWRAVAAACPGDDLVPLKREAAKRLLTRARKARAEGLLDGEPSGEAGSLIGSPRVRAWPKTTPGQRL